MPARKQIVPLTKEENDAKNQRREYLAESTNAALAAALDVAERGGPAEEIAAAAKAATDRFYPPRSHADHIIPAAQLPLEALPRLSGEGWTADSQRAFLVH